MIPTILGQVNPNTAAARNRTRHLARHQAATRTQADWNSVCPQRNPGVRNAAGLTPGKVRTLWDNKIPCKIGLIFEYSNSSV